MRFIMLILTTLASIGLSFTAVAGDFGKVTINRGALPAESYSVAAAFLYQGVRLEYDTTAQIVGEKEVDLYFFPQIGKGDQHVLHLILDGQDSLHSDPAYDLYFNLGDTLIDSIAFSGSAGNAFVFENGRFPPQMHYSSNENGFFSLLGGDVQTSVSGDFEIRFDYPADSSANVATIIRGSLQIPDNFVLTGEATSLQGQKSERKDEFKRNIVIAVLTALFIVIGVGL